MKYFKNNLIQNRKGEYENSRIEVTKRIKTGLTIFFSKTIKNAEKRAEDFATKKGSYVYSIFGYVKKNNKKVFVLVGFGVPK